MLPLLMWVVYQQPMLGLKEELKILASASTKLELTQDIENKFDRW